MTLLLADFVTFNQIDGISGLSGIAPAVFDEPGMYSVGSGMVVAIGDLAGATVVTLLAATATQFARVGRYFLTNFDPSQYSALGSPWFWQPYRKPWR